MSFSALVIIPSHHRASKGMHKVPLFSQPDSYFYPDSLVQHGDYLLGIHLFVPAPLALNLHRIMPLPDSIAAPILFRNLLG